MQAPGHRSGGLADPPWRAFCSFARPLTSLISGSRHVFTLSAKLGFAAHLQIMVGADDRVAVCLAVIISRMSTFKSLKSSSYAHFLPSLLVPFSTSNAKCKSLVSLSRWRRFVQQRYHEADQTSVSVAPAYRAPGIPRSRCRTSGCVRRLQPSSVQMDRWPCQEYRPRCAAYRPSSIIKRLAADVLRMVRPTLLC